MKRKFLKLLLCLTALTSKTVLTYHTRNTTGNEEIDLKGNLFQLENQLKNGMKSLTKMIMPKMMEIAGTQKLSPECVRNGLQLIDGLKNLKTWAFRILDATAKVPDGLISGSTTFLGNYDECLGTVARSSRSRDYGEILFTGKYCLLQIKPELPPKRRMYRIYDRIEEFENVSSSENIIDEIASRMHTFYSYALNLGVCVPSGC
ncbi:hypothetical protein X975_05617, partial [Stegodyphus mimosarum]